MGSIWIPLYKKITRNIYERILKRELLIEKMHPVLSSPASLRTWGFSQDQGVPHEGRVWGLSSHLMEAVLGQSLADHNSFPTQGMKTILYYSSWFIFLFVHFFHLFPPLLKCYIKLHWYRMCKEGEALERTLGW